MLNSLLTPLFHRCTFLEYSGKANATEEVAASEEQEMLQLLYSQLDLALKGLTGERTRKNRAAAELATGQADAAIEEAKMLLDASGVTVSSKDRARNDSLNQWREKFANRIKSFEENVADAAKRDAESESYLQSLKPPTQEGSGSGGTASGQTLGRPSNAYSSFRESLDPSVRRLYPVSRTPSPKPYSNSDRATDLQASLSNWVAAAESLMEPISDIKLTI